MAEIALVRLSRPTRQRLHHTGFRYALQTRTELGDVRDRDFQIIKEDATGTLRSLTQEQSGFQTHESHGRIGPHGLTQRHAAVGIQTGRDIEGEYGAARGIDGADGVGSRAAHCRAQSGTEHGIDNHLTLAQQ